MTRRDQRVVEQLQRADGELLLPVLRRLADVRPTADLQTDRSTDVLADSSLRIDHDCGETVFRNTALRFTVQDSAGSVTFDTRPEASDTRNDYFAASTGSLLLTDRTVRDRTQDTC